ncbi:MAG: DUF6879 family protein [Pseudonocardiaceae bacterium]
MTTTLSPAHRSASGPSLGRPVHDGQRTARPRDRQTRLPGSAHLAEDGLSGDVVNFIPPIVHITENGNYVFRRACIVSEPISDYQKWALKDTPLFVEAGEDIRWVPRSRVSTVALPGNDFWLFDDEVVVFLIFAASGLVVDRHTTSDRGTIELCRTSFEEVWKLSITHSEYRPA